MNTAVFPTIHGRAWSNGVHEACDPGLEAMEFLLESACPRVVCGLRAQALLRRREAGTKDALRLGQSQKLGGI